MSESKPTTNINTDPSLFLFSTFDILERINGYNNQEAKKNRQQAIDNISACTAVSDDEKHTLLQMYYDTCPPHVRHEMSEKDADRVKPKIDAATRKFDDYVTRDHSYDKSMYNDLVTDVKWLIEMNFYISTALATQCAERLVRQVKK